MADPSASTVTPLEGKTTIDDKMVFGPQRLSYSSADAIARRIASKVTAAVKDKSVVIASTSLLADFANLQALYLNLDSLQRDYDAVASYAARMNQPRPKKKAGFQGMKFLTLTGPAGVAIDAGALLGGLNPLAPVTSAIGAAIGLVSLFRQDVEYHGAVTTVDGLAFELALAARVNKAGADKVYVPELTFISPAELGAGSLQARLADIQSAKAKAWAAIGPSVAQLVHLEAQLDTATKEKDKTRVDELTSQVTNMRSDLDPVVTPLGRADQKLTDLQTQWNQTDAASGLTVLARLLRAESIQSMKPLYLHAAIVFSGGYNRISHNLFRTMFLGDGLSFTGGAIARWALLDDDGAVRMGGIASAQLTWGTLWGLHDKLQES